MAEVNSLLKQATAAYQAGRIDQARTLLLSVIEQDEQSEQAWWWLSAVVETLEDQQICLENVLALNPRNTQARQGLDAIGRMIETQGRQARPAPGLPSWLAGEAGPSSRGSAPIGAEFDMVSGDSLIDSLSDIQVKPGVRNAEAPAKDESPFGNWLPESDSPPNVSSDSDPFAPATSVDWGRDDRPAAYGSGKQVDLPSEEEYDNWLQGLNLGPGDGSSSPQQNSPSPFLGAQRLDDDFPTMPPRREPPAPARSVPVIEDDPFAGYEDEDDLPTMMASSPPPAQPAALSEDDDSFWNQSAASIASAPAPVPGRQAFAFEDEEDQSPAPAPAPIQPAAKPADRPSAPTPAAALGREAYFRAIPKDIEAVSGGFGAATLLRVAGIVLLLALNIASFGYLIVSLAG
ncbi:MAG TPA: hypothetical protein PKD09_06300 [Aggregatilinea sp.]|uniref:tetratricopeptide repeat protein n=1 Tax=Aggregatilinea sp. TaxID=2806333 RepID=UPI002C95F126|nr:hypothetical protein [Aggregatilinea sp.]HML21237.1 hypothetical protein [Aggregatilinea sp.]